MSTRTAWLLGLWIVGWAPTDLTGEEVTAAPASPEVRVGFKPAESRTLGLADGEAERRAVVDLRLDKPVSVDFKAVPLREAIQHVLKLADVLPVFDYESLADDNLVRLDNAVSLRVTNVSAKIVLREICEPRGVQVITSDSHAIVSPTDSCDHMRTVVHDVTDLTSRRDGTAFTHELIDLITQAIRPKLWVDVGGANSASTILTGRAALLVVRSDPRTDEEIKSLLDDLRRNGAAIDPSAILVEFDPARQSKSAPSKRVVDGSPNGAGLLAKVAPPANEPQEIRPDSPLAKTRPRGVPRTAGIPATEQACRQEILDRLSRPVALEFRDVSLSCAINQLLERADTVPVFDEVAIADDTTVDLKKSVTLIANGESIRSLLGRLLRPWQLAWIVRSGGVVITTSTVAERQLETMTFDATDFVVTPDGEVRHAGLIGAILSCIEPDEWEDVGGECSLKVLIRPRAVLMVVRSTAHIHREIGDLLNAMRDMGAAAPPTTEIVIPPPRDSIWPASTGTRCFPVDAPTPAPNALPKSNTSAAPPATSPPTKPER